MLKALRRMKFIVILITFIFTTEYFSFGRNILTNDRIKVAFQDTVKQSNDSASKAIDEVIKSGTLPKTEKVKYVNQVTKYGFKSLFNNLSYNSSMPYSSQVNPHAESYMQDYLQEHGSY